MILRIAIPILILLAGWFGYSALSKKEEKGRKPPREEQVIQTKVIALKRQDLVTTVTTQGVVRPQNEAVLSAQVAGKVAEVSARLQDGGFFQEGEILVTLDREDFQASIIAAQASLARAEAAFAQEQTKANQAKLNWEDLGYTEKPNDLVLRLPQLREAEANVLSAQASLERAERDLARADVRAPFTGRVLERSVNVGQTVSPATALASIFSTDAVEIRLPIAARDMAKLALPESEGDAPLPVQIRDALNEDSETVWEAQIVGTGGQLDPESRELFAIARVQDPFSLEDKGARPPLRIGQPVVAEIEGERLEGVLLIPRSAVRNLREVNLVDPETMTLVRMEVDPIWSNEEHLVVDSPEIEDGMLLSTSRLVFAPEGGKVEILPTALDAPITVTDPSPES